VREIEGGEVGLSVVDQKNWTRRGTIQAETDPGKKGIGKKGLGGAPWGRWSVNGVPKSTSTKRNGT